MTLHTEEVELDENVVPDVPVEFNDEALEEALSDFRSSADLPTRFVFDGPAVNRWAPPQLPFELQVEHEVSSPADEILPEPVGDAASRLVEQRIRRLPKELRLAFRTIRSHMHRQDLLDFIEGEVRGRADRSAFMEIEIPGDFETGWILPEIHRRAALQRLAADLKFVRGLRSRVEEIKEHGHMLRLFGHWPRRLPELSECRIPPGDSWNPESWLGLTTSSMPEAAPEEVLGALAQRLWRRYKDVARHPRKERRVGRVLHLGALNSTFAVALIGTAPSGLTLKIDEVDTVGQQQSISWVLRRSSTPLKGHYDLIFVHVPPPGEGANHLRNRYKDMPTPAGEVHLEDLGRRGPRKWRAGLFKVLREVISLLDPDAELALLLPTSVRVTTKKGRYAQWGYHPRPELLDGVVELLGEQGLEVRRDLMVTEENPLSQPFFEDRRCSWRFMVASRRTAVPDSAEDDAVEVALATLEQHLA